MSTYRTAYLVAHFDTSSGVPVYLGAAIYSESGRTLTGAIRVGRFACDVETATGETYEEARERLLSGLADPLYGEPFTWAKPTERR